MSEARSASRANRVALPAAGRFVLCGLIAIALCLFAPACSGSTTSGGTSSVGGTELQSYTALYAAFDEAGATASADGTAAIDTSHAADGYVAAKATSASRLKFQVTCGSVTYNYDLSFDATPAVFPLNCGNGSYTFRIMQNTTGDKYTELYSTTAEVSLSSEFAPFLRNNVFCDYSASSACVQKADSFRSQSTTELDLVTNIYDYITENVDYDYDKASTVESGYVPDPDETYSTGKGICFDYASLAAAMMRSQGIPCKIVTGYVDPDNIYHAWNIIYFQDAGWVSVEISVESNQWKRIDLTFAATEGASGALGDDRTYTDRYVY